METSVTFTIFSLQYRADMYTTQTP